MCPHAGLLPTSWNRSTRWWQQCVPKWGGRGNWLYCASLSGQVLLLAAGWRCPATQQPLAARLQSQLHRPTLCNLQGAVGVGKPDAAQDDAGWHMRDWLDVVQVSAPLAMLHCKL